VGSGEEKEERMIKGARKRRSRGVKYDGGEGGVGGGGGGGGGGGWGVVRGGGGGGGVLRF